MVNVHCTIICLNLKETCDGDSLVQSVFVAFNNKLQCESRTKILILSYLSGNKRIVNIAHKSTHTPHLVNDSE